MKKPDWFLLIENWRAKGMGVYGITLPFLAGALARKARRAEVSCEEITALLDEMCNKPVNGYIVEIRWCADINAPVLSTATLSYPYRMPLKSHFSDVSGQPSLGFSEDLQSMLGLNCNGPKDCLEKLATYAAAYVEKKHFSRNLNSENGQYEYGGFSQRELMYITDTIGPAS